MSIGLVQPNKFCGSVRGSQKRALTTRDYNELEENFTYLDLCLNFLCRQRCLENPDLFELDCTHGKDCQVKNDCHCTTLDECSANDERRNEKFRTCNKTLHRNIRRRVGYQKQKSQQSQQRTQEQKQEQHISESEKDLLQPHRRRKEREDRAYNNFEHFAGEHFDSSVREDAE